jgi:hypothetical protein
MSDEAHRSVRPSPNDEVVAKDTVTDRTTRNSKHTSRPRAYD